MKRKRYRIESYSTGSSFRFSIPWIIGGYVFMWPLSWFLVTNGDLDIIHKDIYPRMTSLLQASWLAIYVGIIINFRISRNPLNKKDYLQFLAFSSWTPQKPLLLGGMQYTLKDVLLIGILVILGTSKMVYHNADLIQSFWGMDPSYWVLNTLNISFIVSVMAMLIPYVFSTILHSAHNTHLIMFNLFLVPLTFYPHYNLHIACLVLIVLYVTCTYGVQQKLAKFQWEKPYYDNDTTGTLREAARKSAVVDGEWYKLAFHDTFDRLKLHNKLIGFAIFGWWIQAFCGVSSQHDSPIAPASMMVAALALVFFHSLPAMYRFFAMMPIPLYARLFTGRLILPKFDWILIRPLFMLLYSITIGSLYGNHHITMILCVYLLLLGWVLITHLTPPTLAQWHYTALKSMGPNVKKFKLDTDTDQND